ncbi:MAG TPA: class I SAM-dependent methyltransferase [Chitinivibrionales bacterium]|nr:class I SAM-dependent methyltransferase [Chitinivibrionales bacterium]
MNYRALAPLYDRLMAHVGYHRWHSLIEEIIHRYCAAARPSIFEIGAGTGMLGERLCAAGFHYIASDLSHPMCVQARRRLKNVVCADGRLLPLRGRAGFDLVLFLYDGINYLLDKAEYERLFSEVYAHLYRDGLFLFDVTTVYNSTANFNEYVDADDFGEHFYFRHSYYQPFKNMQYNDFTIFSRNNGSGAAPRDDGAGALALSLDNSDDCLYTKSMEHHEQKVFPVNVIKGFVPPRLFDILGMWDDFSFKKHTACSERVHFLLRKKDGA